MSRPAFVILGAGAIGSIIGAHLARAGHEVVMLARGQRARHLQQHGLTLKGLVEFTVPVRVLTDPSQLSGADVLIVAMKTPGTREALAPLRAADIGVAFSIQNGLWKNEVLADCFGTERVLGSLANTSGELLPEGDVLFTRNVNLSVGELTGGLSPRAERIATTIDDAGVRCEAVPDMLAREWTKFVGWVGLMSLAVTTRALTWRYLTDPDCARVLVAVTREMGQLARAEGVTLVDEESLVPQRTIIEASEDEAIAAVIASGERFRCYAPQHRMSALQDVSAGRALEVHETLGHAVERAAAHGLQLPAVEAFYRLVAGIDRLSRI